MIAFAGNQACGFSETIRIGIAGEWSVPEFAELMSQIQFITGMTIFLTADGRIRDESGEFFKRWQVFSPSSLEAAFDGFASVQLEPSFGT
jgi:hypothetical protein